MKRWGQNYGTFYGCDRGGQSTLRNLKHSPRFMKFEALGALRIWLRHSQYVDIDIHSWVHKLGVKVEWELGSDMEHCNCIHVKNENPKTHASSPLLCSSWKIPRPQRVIYSAARGALWAGSNFPSLRNNCHCSEKFAFSRWVVVAPPPVSQLSQLQLWKWPIRRNKFGAAVSFMASESFQIFGKSSFQGGFWLRRKNSTYLLTKSKTKVKHGSRIFHPLYSCHVIRNILKHNF